MDNTTLFDKILNHKESNHCIVANPYLHILRNHPEFLKVYNTSQVEKLWLSIRSKLIFLVRIFQSMFNGKYDYLYNESVKFDVLFVSHLTNEQQLLKGDDVYFSDLTDQLLGHGVSSGISLIKHTKVNKHKILNGWIGSKIPRFILSSSLNFLTEVNLYLAQKKTKRQLKSILEDLRIDEKLAKDILRYHLSSGTLNSHRVAKQVADIVRKTGAKFVVTTYEGHAWERLVYYYVRKINPNIKCLGYQHAAIFKHQHAIKRSLGNEYDPDIILTSGLISKDIFKQWQLKGSEVVCMGSPKHLKPNITTGKNQSCLVVPEGFVSECLILFNISLEYAKQHRSQRFIWRLHPLLSFKKLKKQSSIFKNLPDNITLSEANLEDDINQCDSVLYRGSTAVVNAINVGLKPIYYRKSADELSIDPIYTHKKGKSIVHNQEELGLALDRDIDAKTMQSLQDFAQDFYTPLNVNIFLKALQ
jgi:hypothetical protein